MATLRFKNVGIKAISACVPKTVVSNRELGYLIPEEEIDKTINNIGIEERRVADADCCSSDLCFCAAQQLIQDNEIDIQSVGALIFVSQTSDYHQPATAPILQHRLGLSKDTLAFDVNLACSGYVYGLSTAFAYANLGMRVLLLVGETMSKIVSKQDKVNTPLFGDAGTASLIEPGEYGDAVFSLHSDGGGALVMNVPYGGFRNQSCADSLKEVEDTDGSIRTGEQFRMDGMDVFNFGMREEPKDIKRLLSECNMTIDQVDVLVYHQANKFMTDFFSKKLKIDASHTPYCLKKFGNTSSASIPLTIVTQMKNGYKARKRSILSGFGAGLSWGSVMLDLSKCAISELIEY